ncbi:MAG: GDP-mannose 4,6-dehydratase [Chloroflexota bacterium]
MRVLVTGAGGFVGPHLLQHLHSTQATQTLFGTAYNPHAQRLPFVTYHTVNLLDYDATLSLLRDTQPDLIYHLAGQSSPSKALKALWQTHEINVRIQLNIFEACLELGIKPRILSISSGEIYCGGATDPDSMPVDETAELQPSNPYALSKATQDLMGLQYFLSYKLPVVRVRPFNHTGPGQQESFVAPDFALQIARIEAGTQDPVMRVGNLEAERDFTDVRDVVRAYALLAEKGEAGQAYNVASNRAFSVQFLLDTLLRFTDAKIRVEIDPAKFRPVDVPIVQGDNSRLRELTGWQPSIEFEQTLRDLLDDCRARVQPTTRSK